MRTGAVISEVGQAKPLHGQRRDGRNFGGEKTIERSASNSDLCRHHVELEPELTIGSAFRKLARISRARTLRLRSQRVRSCFFAAGHGNDLLEDAHADLVQPSQYHYTVSRYHAGRCQVHRLLGSGQRHKIALGPDGSRQALDAARGYVGWIIAVENSRIAEPSSIPFLIRNSPRIADDFELVVA